MYLEPYFIMSQWCQCDLRTIDMTTLQKFAVVMADPPWDIHMELPYGTMSDDEMRKLNVPCLQDEGYIFLWVTGRYGSKINGFHLIVCYVLIVDMFFNWLLCSYCWNLENYVLPVGNSYAERFTSESHPDAINA